MKSLLVLLDNLKDSQYKGNIISSAIKNTFNLNVELVESNLTFDSGDIFGFAVFDYLHKFKEPAFLITDKAIVQLGLLESMYSPGAVHLTYPVGYTSTFSLNNSNDIGLITQITLHEVGHIMKLDHHEKKVTENNKLCLMKPHDLNHSFDDYINNVSPYLCKNCKKELGYYVSPLKSFLKKAYLN